MESNSLFFIVSFFFGGGRKHLQEGFATGAKILLFSKGGWKAFFWSFSGWEV